MTPQDKHAKIVALAGHGIGILGGLTSGAILFIKLATTGWHIALATSIATIAALLLIFGSEGLGVFALNLAGLYLQKLKPISELKGQIRYNVIGCSFCAILVGALAYASISNIVTFQTMARDKEAVDINALPTVAHLYQTVKSLEDQLKGAELGAQAAQDRFKSYEGTNQRTNQGRANQAAQEALNDKKKLASELETARTAYLSIYSLEVAKGTNVLDRAEGAHNSKVIIAGLLEIGTALIILISIMLGAFVRARSTLFLVDFDNAISVPAEKVEQQSLPAPKVEAQGQKQEVKSEAPKSQVFPKQKHEMRLEELVVAVCQDRAECQDLCNRFKLKPHQARRLVKHTQAGARLTPEGRAGNPAVLLKLAIESIKRMDSLRDLATPANSSVQPYQEHEFEHLEEHLTNTNGTLARH